ncbi:serine carboxypeptidase [Apiospora kogelbergensis]|uniref:Carboxypeptidase n=1 Tax=Apiospora kogelbergensis TaxID=1337665 RepID=A0AAW0QYE7_9PEZI
MVRLSIPFLVGLLGLGTEATFMSPPDDLKMVMGHAGVPVRYKQVEAGICELDPDVKSFSGYADVAEDQHIFWWFFEARHGNPEEAPLTVWINGGPGSSSMMGLFQELGPCGVDPYGEVYSNPHSWSNVSNMLFIDQPTQTGLSYTKPVPGYKQGGDVIELPDNICPDYVADPSSCGTYSHPNMTLTANSTEGAAKNFWLTLQGFMGAFPQYTKNGFNLATESYGGHYGPVFSAYIERRNDRLTPSTVKIPLKTLLVGNGWFDPIIGYQAFYNFTVSPGNTYGYAPFDDDTAADLYDSLYGAGNCLDQLRDCQTSGRDDVCARADDFCADHVEYPYGDLAGRSDYDVRQPAPDPFPYTFYEDYLNTPRVQRALGAATNYTKSSRLVARAFHGTGDDARGLDIADDLRFLLSRNVTVALYAGDADFDCNWLGVEAFAEPFFQAPSAGYADLRTSDNITHGQTRQAGRFSFTRVYESGHMVPFYQPLAALELFGRAIGGRDVATGRELAGPLYRTNGTARTTYWNGDATMQWEVVMPNRTYDVTTNGPGAFWDDVVKARG